MVRKPSSFLYKVHFESCALRQKLGQILRRGRTIARWAVTELPRAPGLEAYSRYIDRDNRALTSHLRSSDTAALREYTANYHGWDIPKIIWIYWAQGEDQAPYLVRRCIASWREQNPGWDVRVLDEDGIAHHAEDMATLESLPRRFTANLLRLQLLARHGGVWVDATTLCHRPLDDWIPLMAGQTGFFVFRGPYFDRWLDNWFIAANPKNELINAWVRHYHRYVSGLRAKPDKYFMTVYVFQWMVLKRKELRHAFRATGGLPAVPAFFLQAYLEGKSDAEPFMSARAKGFPLSKLNWKFPIAESELKARLEDLDLERGG